MRTDLLLVIQSKKAHFGQEKFGLPQLPDGTVTRHGLDERHRCAYERLLTTLKLPYPLGDSLCDANMYGFKPSLRRQHRRVWWCAIGRRQYCAHKP